MALPVTFELACGDGRLLRYCLYGPLDGFPVIFHVGSPSSRWKWPHLIEAMEHSRLRLLVYDRPGYGGSTRQPGRVVASVVEDVRALADAHGWQEFGVFGGSGGGPHALACAALLAGRVTRCAVLSGIKPADPGTVPRDESALRSRLTARTDDHRYHDIRGRRVDHLPGEQCFARSGPGQSLPAAMWTVDAATIVQSRATLT